jgi:hypothetical protein
MQFLRLLVPVPSARRRTARNVPNLTSLRQLTLRFRPFLSLPSQQPCAPLLLPLLLSLLFFLSSHRRFFVVLLGRPLCRRALYAVVPDESRGLHLILMTHCNIYCHYRIHIRPYIPESDVYTLIYHHFYLRCAVIIFLHYIFPSLPLYSASLSYVSHTPFISAPCCFLSFSNSVDLYIFIDIYWLCPSCCLFAERCDVSRTQLIACL